MVEVNRGEWGENHDALEHVTEGWKYDLLEAESRRELAAGDYRLMQVTGWSEQKNTRTGVKSFHLYNPERWDEFMEQVVIEWEQAQC